MRQLERHLREAVGRHAQRLHARSDPKPSDDSVAVAGDHGRAVEPAVLVVAAGPPVGEHDHVTVAFVRDLDGYLVEFVERHPWPADAPSEAPWLGRYCLNVTDLAA